MNNKIKYTYISSRDGKEYFVKKTYLMDRERFLTDEETKQIINDYPKYEFSLSYENVENFIDFYSDYHGLTTQEKDLIRKFNKDDLSTRMICDVDGWRIEK